MRAAHGRAASRSACSRARRTRRDARACAPDELLASTATASPRRRTRRAAPSTNRGSKPCCAPTGRTAVAAIWRHRRAGGRVVHRGYAPRRRPDNPVAPAVDPIAARRCLIQPASANTSDHDGEWPPRCSSCWASSPVAPGVRAPGAGPADAVPVRLTPIRGAARPDRRPTCRPTTLAAVHGDSSSPLGRSGARSTSSRGTEISSPAPRAVVLAGARSRSRSQDTPPDNGYRLIVDAVRRVRIARAHRDLAARRRRAPRRRAAGSIGGRRAAHARSSSLYRLTLDPTQAVRRAQPDDHRRGSRADARERLGVRRRHRPGRHGARAARARRR